MATIIDFTRTGGMHFAQNDLAFMQEAWREGLSAVARLCGHLVILYGMEDNGSAYGPGAVAINGEILPFAGGGKMPNLAIQEDKSGNTFRDGVIQEIYTLRKVVTTSVGGFPLSSFTRLSEIKNLVSTAQLNTKISDLINSSPAALDTLKELADALGNDSNFSTSVANNIAGKVSKTGDSMSGNLSIPNATADGHAVNKGQMNESLSGKANLVGGKVPISEIPAMVMIRYKGSCLIPMSEVYENKDLFMVNHGQNLADYKVIGNIRAKRPLSSNLANWTDSWDGWASDWHVETVPHTIAEIKPNYFRVLADKRVNDWEYYFDYILV